MIIRDKGEVWQVEMFHVVNLGKKNPEANFKDYLNDLMQEFTKQITTTKFCITNNLPIVDVTDSHKVVEDNV